MCQLVGSLSFIEAGHHSRRNISEIFPSPTSAALQRGPSKDAWVVGAAEPILFRELLGTSTRRHGDPGGWSRLLVAEEHLGAGSVNHLSAS